MTLAEKIFTLRKKNGLSQDELAQELGVTRQAVYKWESGIASPEIDKLKSLSKLFDVSFDYLLNDEIDEYSKEKADGAAKRAIRRAVFRRGDEMLDNQPSIDHGYPPERKKKTDMSDAYFARRRKAAEEGMKNAGATEIIFISSRATAAFFYDEVKRAIGFYYGSAVQLVCPIENLAGFSYQGGGVGMINSRSTILGISNVGFGVGSIPAARAVAAGPISATLLYHEDDGIKEFSLRFNPFQDYIIYNFNANRDMVDLVQNSDTNTMLDNLSKIQLRLDALRDSAQMSVSADMPEIDVQFYSAKNEATLKDYSIFRQRVLAEINGTISSTPKMEPKEPPVHKLSQELPQSSNDTVFISKASDFLSGAGRYLLLGIFLFIQVVGGIILIPTIAPFTIIGLLIGLIPAFIAKNKGRYFIKWWIYGTYLFLIALIHSLVISPDY